MHPRLLTTPWLTVPTFGVFLSAAYVAAFAWLVRSARKASLDHELVVDLAVWAILGALIGAKALLAIRTFGGTQYDSGELVSLLTSAGDFYGGFIGGLAAAAYFLYRHRALSFWRVADAAAPAIALGQAIGRIGCFMAGDDYGRPATLPWAVVFNDPDAARVGGVPLGIALHPVQLYESVFCAMLFGALVWLARRPHRVGSIMLTYMVSYAIGRFVLEFFRGDGDRGFIGPLSTSQFIAVCILIASAIAYIRRQPVGAEPSNP